MTGDTFDLESDIKDVHTKIKDQENLEIEEEKKKKVEDSDDVEYFFDKTWEWDKLPSELDIRLKFFLLCSKSN